MINWAEIAAAISAVVQHPIEIQRIQPLSGGDIYAAFELQTTSATSYFVKLNKVQRTALFTAEALGLQALADCATVRVPQYITQGKTEQHSFLVLEFLALGGRVNEYLLGEQLAQMHRCQYAQFGFAQDNFIGSTPQQNGWINDWVTFWRERRLLPQLKLVLRNGHSKRLYQLGENLLAELPVFFSHYQPVPSLLHGDLWSGNHGYLKDGTPVIFDPACYYGDRECDLAMTELFGGYGADFYAAYKQTWPLDDGYLVRRDLYNLYHILNHANLFGGGYAQQAERVIARLLAEIK